MSLSHLKSISHSLSMVKIYDLSEQKTINQATADKLTFLTFAKPISLNTFTPHTFLITRSSVVCEDVCRSFYADVLPTLTAFQKTRNHSNVCPHALLQLQQSSDLSDLTPPSQLHATHEQNRNLLINHKIPCLCSWNCSFNNT